MRIGRIILCVITSLFLLALDARAGEVVEITIETVLATNSSQEVDQRLGQIKQQLHTLFRYSSYRLVKEESRQTRWGDQASFNIPGGRYLQVIPKGFRDNCVSMRVMLIEGDRPMVDTQLILRNGGVFFVGGRRHQEGVLIISIGAATEE
jgi:hypothetical protein